MPDVGTAGADPPTPAASLASRISGLLARDHYYYATVALLVAVTATVAFSFRHDFAALGSRVVPIEDEEVERWERWANHYDQLFGMLRWGERVGIQTSGQRGSGIVLERTGDGMVARRAFLLANEDPAVVLMIDRDATEDLLSSVPETEPDAIWQMVKDRLYGRQITVWSDPDLDRLQEGGYLAFLRAIDTRPKGVEWPEIKRRLGES